LGFRVWGLGFRVWGLGFRVWGLGFRVQGLVFGVWGLGYSQPRCRLGFAATCPRLNLTKWIRFESNRIEARWIHS
jgi:hypothetical protein